MTWIQDKKEVEVVDLVLRLREKLVNLSPNYIVRLEFMLHLNLVLVDTANDASDSVSLLNVCALLYNNDDVI